MCSVSKTPSLPPLIEIALSIDKATRIINSTLPAVILIVGCISNVLIIVAFRSHHFKQTIASCYILCLAVNDIAALLTLVPHWLNAAFPDAIQREKGDSTVCKVLMFYGWSQMDFAIVLVALMSHERAKMLDTHQKPELVLTEARKTLIVVITICAAKNFHLLFSSVMVNTRAMLCSVRPPSCPYELFFNFVWPWIHLLFQGGCFAWMTVSNNRIVKYFHRRRPSSGALDRKMMNRISGMLVTQSIVFTVLALPLSLHIFVINLLAGIEYIDFKYGTTPLAIAVTGLTFAITYNVLFCSKCVVFAVYVVFSKKFRTALSEEMSTLMRAVRNHQSVAPATTPRSTAGGSRARDAAPESGTRKTEPACQNVRRLAPQKSEKSFSTTSSVNG